MSSNIGIDGFADSSLSGLEEYTSEVREELPKIAKRLGNRARKKLKETSPRGDDSQKHYADAWRISQEKTIGGVELTIHNASKPGLTHLLEKGHLNVDGSRTDPIVHIAPVQEELNEEFQKEVEKMLEGK